MTASETLLILLASRPGIALCWLGNDGWLISRRGRLIAFDLDLHTPIRLQRSPLSAREIAPHLDALFITHEHGDHLNPRTVRALARESDCRFVIPASCVKKAAALGLPQSRIVVARPGVAFRLDGLHVRPLRAIHGDRGTSVWAESCPFLLKLQIMM